MGKYGVKTSLDSDLERDEMSLSGESLDWPDISASSYNPSELLDSSILAIRNGQKLLTDLVEFIAVLARLGVDSRYHFKRPSLDAYAKRIGHGAQFDVFIDKYDIQKDVVFKRVRRDLIINDADASSLDEARRSRLRTVQLEISSLCDPRRRNNRNIVDLVGWGYDYPSSVLDDRIPVLVMERATCSLLQLLQKGNHTVQSPIAIAIRHHICLDIAEGISCIHSTGLVHGDIKPGNVLIFETDDPKVPFLAKLSDFGQCLDLEDSMTGFSAYQGTDGWQPPEVSIEDGTHEKAFAPDLLQKSDSFVFGLLALSVFLKDGERLFVSLPQNFPWETSRLIDRSTDASLDRTIKQMLKNLCYALLTNSPQGRANVTFELLRCESVSFADWFCVRASSINQTIPGKKLIEGSYNYWRHLEDAILSQLETQYDDLLTKGKIPTYTGETLVGMAVSHSFKPRLGYGDKVVKFVRAAAELGYVPAQGFIKRLEDAHNQVRKKDESPDELRNWLFNAASTGSYIALQDLSAEDKGLFEAAKNHFRNNGGHNPEMAETAKTKLKLLLENCHKFCDDHDVQMAVDLQGNTILHIVAVYGLVELIRLLVAKGATIDARNDVGETPLYKACLAGNSDSVEALVSLSADASITSRPHNISCLHWLFNFDPSVMEKTVELLNSNGANVRAMTFPMLGGVRQWKYWAHFPFHWPQGSPLHWASFTGSYEAIEALLKGGAHVDDLNAEDETNAQTALSMAMYRADQSMVNFLISKGANATFLDGRGCSPAHMLALDVTQTHHFFDISKALHWWVYHGTFENHLAQVTESANALKSAGNDLQSQTRRQSSGFHVSPLIDAVSSGDGGVVLGLLAAGTSASCVDNLERTPLHIWILSCNSSQLAYCATYERVCENLLRGMANINARDTFGETIVHCALYSLDFRYLIEYFMSSDRRVDINAANDLGETPLLASLRFIDVDVDGKSQAGWYSHVLQQYGADVDARDHDGCDFIWNVCNNKALFDDECLSLIEIRLHALSDQEQRLVVSRSINKRTGITALHAAILNKHISAVKLFIHLGLDINVACNGWTALDRALVTGDYMRKGTFRTWLIDEKLVLRDKLEPRRMKDSLFEETHTESDRGSYAVNGINFNAREKYFAASDVIDVLISAGGKSDKHFIAKAELQFGPRASDAHLAEVFELRDFTAEKQLFYERWAVLYELMEY